MIVKSKNLPTALFESPAIICAKGAAGMDKAYNKNHNGFGGPSDKAPPPCTRILEFEGGDGSSVFEGGIDAGGAEAGGTEAGGTDAGGTDAGGAEGAGVFDGAEGTGVFDGTEGAGVFDGAFFTLEPFPENIEFPDSDSFHIPCANPSAPQG
jgi:hypothetical protein